MTPRFRPHATESPPPPPPVPLNQENVPDDLICSICMTVPVEPRITPCSHLFCLTCIRQALRTQNLCPIDRRSCTQGQLKRLDGLSLRIWSGIQVKCGYYEIGCAWRGSIADYSSHTENCTVSRNSSAATSRNNTAMAEEIRSIRERLDDAIELNRTISDDNAQLLTENLELEQKIRSLEQERASLQKSLKSRPNVPKLFTGSYYYKRENVVQLSQLISRYLENKPAEIDRNKIYNCVRSCYNDLVKGYSDNPEHYYMDMRMLLATCLASTWFSDNQLKSLRNWYNDQFN